MIFVALGTQKFQMNRLVKDIDEQKRQGLINDEIFGQIGNSDYIPKNYKFKSFINGTEFNEKIENSDVVITHSGVSTIIKALKLNKKVIVVPRLAKYGEHVDDHQMEIAENFSKLNYVFMVLDTNELHNKIKEIKTHNFNTYISGNEKMISTIEEFITNWSTK